MIENSMILMSIPLTKFAGYFEYELQEHEVQPNDNWFDMGFWNLRLT